MLVFEDSRRQDESDALARLWAGAEPFVFAPPGGAEAAGRLAGVARGLPAGVTGRGFGLLTSGSTGAPRLVLADRDRAERMAAAIHAAQGAEACEEALCVLPLSYCYAFVNQWVWSLVHRRRFRRSAGLADPARFAEDLRASRAAMLCLVGPQLGLIAGALGSMAFPGVRLVNFAGAPPPVGQLDVVRRMFPGAAICFNYGCTEAMPRLTVLPLQEGQAPPRPGFIGRPLPGVRFSVLEGGGLGFQSDYAARAVVDQDAVELLEPDRFVPTGDLAEPLDDGWVLRGRVGEVFKRYGEKVAPPEVAAELAGALAADPEAPWRGEMAFYLEDDRRGEPGYVLVLSPPPDRPAVLRVLRALGGRRSRA
jgi:acyl-CoA synthetase (AMP-forming)/AMP-acid ligase II